MNRVIITNDLEKALSDITYDELFLRDELKIDDVHEIKKRAYIAEKKKKTIVIAAKKYNIYAQNALLKILEESPKNVEFILIATSKYLLLDTIVSRLALEKRIYDSPQAEFELEKITNEKILELLKQNLSKEELISLLKQLLKKDLNEELLKLINDAVIMAELNIDINAIISLIMLGLKVEK